MPLTNPPRSRSVSMKRSGRGILHRPSARGDLLLQVVSSGFFAIAADLHVAPPPRAVPASVEKQPGASLRLALANSREIVRGQEFGRRAHHGGKHRRELVPVVRETP